MPPAQAWEIGPQIGGRNYSVGMPAHPSPGSRGSLVIDFPVAGSGQVDALTTAVRPLAGARQITMKYRVDAARGARFVAVERPNEPATVSLYFQQAGDNWSAKGRYASYRWYAPAHAVIPLAPGEHTVTVRFDERWTNVNGKPNHQAPEAFAAALGKTSQIGIAFGSQPRRLRDATGELHAAKSRYRLNLGRGPAAVPAGGRRWRAARRPIACCRTERRPSSASR